MTERIYPRAQAPLTWAVLEAANDRADRWMHRYLAARAECDRLQAIIAEGRPPLSEVAKINAMSFEELMREQT